MTDFSELAGWKRTLRTQVHTGFAVLFIAASVCYSLGSIPGAGAMFGLGVLLEISSWIVLARNAGDEGAHRSRSGLE